MKAPLVLALAAGELLRACETEHPDVLRLEVITPKTRTTWRFSQRDNIWLYAAEWAEERGLEQD